MSFRRYIAANSRDALAQLRRELGDDAVILSSRRLGDQYEILAAGPHTMERLVESAQTSHVDPRGAARPRRPATAGATQPRQVARSASAPRIEQGESFQEYVRRQTQAAAQAAAAARAAVAPAISSSRPKSAQSSTAVAARYREVAQADAAATDEDIWKPTTFHVPPSRPAQDERVARAVVQEAAAPLVPPRFAQREPQPTATTVTAPQSTASMRLPTRRTALPGSAPAGTPAVFRRRSDALDTRVGAVAAAVTPPVAPPALQSAAAVVPVAIATAPVERPLDELQAMRNQLQQQIASLSTTVASSRAQLQTQINLSLTQIRAAAENSTQTMSGRVMTRLLTAGFSPEVARKVALHAPGHLALPEVESWLQDVIALNLKVAVPEVAITEAGGAFALVGPTGVGKTTTVAKIAAQFAVKYGSGALGLITLDAYRVGAHEQLRAYGRILGAPVHLAQDGATLRELLGSLQNKRLVLIDTCGVSQRDGRLSDVLAMLSWASVGVPEAMRINRVLLVNAASHAETLDDAARAWRAPECSGCVLTKLDEAARIGGALDTALRYKMRLYGVTNGQRVPEDWHPANARVLTHLALRPGSDAFALAEGEALAVAADSAAQQALRSPVHA